MLYQDKSTASIVLLALSFALLLPLVARSQSEFPLHCNGNWAAEFVSVEGQVQFRENSAAAWRMAEPATPLCYGDSVRVLEGQAHMRLPDDTLLVLDAQTNATFETPGDADSSGTLIDLLRGLIHVISRDPRSLRINTPFVNAGLEGTEFSISADDNQSRIVVIEGEVSLSNEIGTVYVPAGAIGTSGTVSAPSVEPANNLFNSLAWLSSIPAIVDRNTVTADQSEIPSNLAEAEFFALRAAARIERRNIEAAHADIARALVVESNQPLANALTVMLGIYSPGQGSDELLLKAQTNFRQSPNFVPAVLALSHAEEVLGDSDTALAVTATSSIANPTNPLLWIRLAELRSAAGNPQAALPAAQRAIELDRQNADAHVASGFAYLHLNYLDAAMAAFTSAMSIKSDRPIAYLGAALVYARRDNLAAAQRELEVAVALAPTSSRVRHHMAALYSAQNRGPISDVLLELATTLEPNNRAAWLQRAINAQQSNSSVEAAWALQRAVGDTNTTATMPTLQQVTANPVLNDSGFARIFRNLGFDQQSREYGRNTVMTNPLDPRGHRMLADTYSSLPRHQIARANEHYAALLLQPSVNAPVQPHFAEANLFLLDQLGPSDLASTDLASPLVHNGINTQISAISASNATEGLEFLLNGGGDRLGFNVGYLDFGTDGFRANSDFDQRVASALVQFAPNDSTNMFVELRALDISRGDVRYLFDRNAFLPGARSTEQSEALRIGVRQRLNAQNTLLVLLSFADYEASVLPSSFFRIEGTDETKRADLQHILSLPRWMLTSGLRLTDTHGKDRSVFENAPIPVPPFSFSGVDETTRLPDFSVAYSYATYAMNDALHLTMGIDLIDYSNEVINSTAMNPKFGFVWQILPATSLRAALGSTTNGSAQSKFAIDPSLMPTHIAGFNQQYFGSFGESAKQQSVSLRHTFSDQLQAGVEIVNRNIDTPSLIFDPFTATQRTDVVDREELEQIGYIYWTPTARMALSAEYQRERFNNNDSRFVDGFTRLDTRRVPLTLSYYHPSRFSTNISTTWVDQDGEFFGNNALGAVMAEYGQDTFTVWDLEGVYRLPKRRGDLAVRIANLFDERFAYQDADPENPRIMPERMVSFRFTLNY